MSASGPSGAPEPAGAPDAPVTTAPETGTPPLPLLTPENDWYWTSGADGRLRIQRCEACSEYVHPPAARCPSCGAGALVPSAVGGEGTVVALSVNHHPWLAAFPPPYAVAAVALDEDPTVRITTNLIGAPLDAFHIGQRVRVRFRQHDDVWLPLFEPSGQPDAALPEDTEQAAIRPMVRTAKFEDAVVVSGVGTSRIGRRLGTDPVGLAVDACRAAVADAGLTLAEIDGIATYPGPPALGGHSEGGVRALEEALRIHPTWINGGLDANGQTGSLVTAMLAVAGGLCRHVLCVRTVWESTYAQRAKDGVYPPDTGRVSGAALEWRAPFGAMSAATWIGLPASQYFARYGATRELLGWIAVADRANARRNPEAIYRDPLTLDDYFAARLVSTPFGLYDCDVPCDASTAIVISSVDTVADLGSTPVYVEAAGTQVTERISWDQASLSHEPQVLGPGAHLWTRTDLGVGDVDVALLYDGFTFNVVSWLEALGFCGIGEAQDFLDGGAALMPGGSLGFNPHGGQLSAGRTHGYGFIREAVLQLRGQAGERQVPDARVAVMTSGGGAPGGALLLRR